jgi:glycosyltransferase involved in cell wall biosynthesis
MLTVLIPTKDQSQYLDYLVKTILGSGSPVEELIICDDGSSDDTFIKLCELKKTYSKLVVDKNQENIGAIKTVNKIFNMASQPYCMFMSSDDIFYPDKLNNLLSRVIDADAVVGYGKYYINENGVNRELKHPGWVSNFEAFNDDLFLNLLANDHFIFGAVAIYKKEFLPLFDKVGVPFDISYDQLVSADGAGEFRAHDWNLALGVSEIYPDRYVHMDEYCGEFRVVPGQLSGKDIYLSTGRAAYEMALIILRRLLSPKVYARVAKDTDVKQKIFNLLVAKCRQVDKNNKLGRIYSQQYNLKQTSISFRLKILRLLCLLNLNQ